MSWCQVLSLVLLSTLIRAEIYNQEVVRLDPPDDIVYIEGDSNVIEVIGGVGSNITIQGNFNEFSQLNGANIHTLNGTNNRFHFRGNFGNNTITMNGSENGVNFEGGDSKMYVNNSRDSDVTVRGQTRLQLSEYTSGNRVTIVEGQNVISILGSENELTSLGGDNEVTLSGPRHKVRLQGGYQDVFLSGDQSHVWVQNFANTTMKLTGSEATVRSNAEMRLDILGEDNIVILENGTSRVNVIGDRNLVNFDAGTHVASVNGTHNEITASTTEQKLDITVDGWLLELGPPRENPEPITYGGNTIRLPWEIGSARHEPVTSPDNTGVPKQVTTPTLANQAGAGLDYVTPSKYPSSNNGTGPQTPTWAPYFTPSRTPGVVQLVTPTPTAGVNPQRVRNPEKLIQGPARGVYQTPPPYNGDATTYPYPTERVYNAPLDAGRPGAWADRFPATDAYGFPSGRDQTTEKRQGDQGGYFTPPSGPGPNGNQGNGANPGSYLTPSYASDRDNNQGNQGSYFTPSYNPGVNGAGNDNQGSYLTPSSNQQPNNGNGNQGSYFTPVHNDNPDVGNGNNNGYYTPPSDGNQAAINGNGGGANSGGYLTPSSGGDNNPSRGPYYTPSDNSNTMGTPGILFYTLPDQNWVDQSGNNYPDWTQGAFYRTPENNGGNNNYPQETQKASYYTPVGGNNDQGSYLTPSYNDNPAETQRAFYYTRRQGIDDNGNNNNNNNNDDDDMSTFPYIPNPTQRVYVAPSYNRRVEEGSPIRGPQADLYVRPVAKKNEGSYVTPSGTGDSSQPRVTPRKPSDAANRPNVVHLQSGNSGGTSLVVASKHFIALTNLLLTMVTVWMMTSSR